MSVEPGPATVRWGRGDVRHARLPLWVLDADVSDRSVRLYCLLARHADDGGSARISKTKLMQRLRCARSTLDAAIVELEGIDALAVVEHEREDGGKAANGYLLHWLDPSYSRVGSSDGSEGGTSDGSEGQPRARHSTSFESKNGSSEDANASSSDPVSARPPKLHKVDGQNLGWNAIREVCGIAEGSNREKRVSGALNGSKPHGIDRGIRELAWTEIVQAHFEGDYDQARRYVESDPERFERAVEALVHRRSAQYRQALPGAVITPTALAQWWLDLEAAQPARPRGLTPEEVRGIE